MRLSRGRPPFPEPFLRGMCSFGRQRGTDGAWSPAQAMFLLWGSFHPDSRDRHGAQTPQDRCPEQSGPGEDQGRPASKGWGRAGGCSTGQCGWAGAPPLPLVAWLPEGTTGCTQVSCPGGGWSWLRSGRPDPLSNPWGLEEDLGQAAISVPSGGKGETATATVALPADPCPWGMGEVRQEFPVPSSLGRLGSPSPAYGGGGTGLAGCGRKSGSSKGEGGKPSASASQ